MPTTLPNTTSSNTSSNDSDKRKRVLYLAVPIILANITVPLTGIVDTAVMGHMESPDYLSATAIGAILFSSIYWIFGFLRMGTGGLVAQAIGADEHERARRTLVRALLMGACLGIVIFSLSPLLFPLGLWAMSVSSTIRDLSSDYFFVRVFSAPATLMLYAMIGALVGLQKMRQVLYLQLLLNIGNILLTLLFFNITDWDIRGVALATLLSEYLALVYAFWVLWPQLKFNRQQLRQGLPRWVIDRQRLREFFKISSDLFIRTLCLTAAFYWLTACSARLGPVVLAANAILIQMLHFMAHALDGFAHAAETLSGHAFGKRDREAFLSAVRACVFWSALFALIFTVVYGIAFGPIAALMSTQSTIQNAAKTWFFWIVLSPLVGVWSFLLDGIFTGTTHTREMRDGMMVSLGIFIIATFLLVPLFGNHGLWMSYYALMLARTVTLCFWYPRILNTITQRAI